MMLVIQLRLVLEDRAGGCVDLVVIFHIAGLELDFVDERSVLVVQLDVHVIRLIFTQARMVQGDGLRLGIADVSAAGRRGGLCRRIWRRSSSQQVLLSAGYFPRISGYKQHFI